MELITGRTGTPHVTSEQFRCILETLAGEESYISQINEQLEAVLAPNNTIRIKSGMLLHHGAAMIVENGTYDEINYENCTQGMSRCDLVVARYKKNSVTGIESVEWEVIQGTPTSGEPDIPEYTSGNLQKGDPVDDCPMYYVYHDGINVKSIKKIQKNASNIPELLSKQISVTRKTGKFTFASGTYTHVIDLTKSYNNLDGNGFILGLNGYYAQNATQLLSCAVQDCRYLRFTGNSGIAGMEMAYEYYIVKRG